MSAIAVLGSSRMTEDEYDRERANLRSTYSDSSVEAVAKRDQALAILFGRSGWTEERLTKKEGVAHQWVSYRMCFGRFLNFASSLAEPESLPKNLSAKRFLDIWEQQTVQKERNERIRFQQVLKIMRSESIAAARRPSIGKSIKEKFADGKWHPLNTIVEGVGADKKHVLDTINGMSKNGYFGCKVERKRVGTHTEFRIFKENKRISLDELVEKLTPIIKDLKAEGRKNMATMSPATVGYLAGMLEKLVEEWVG
jgi:hypothetical protein